MQLYQESVVLTRRANSSLLYFAEVRGVPPFLQRPPVTMHAIPCVKSVNAPQRLEKSLILVTLNVRKSFLPRLDPKGNSQLGCV